MNLLFYLSAAVAIVSTLLAVTRTNIVHALLYLIVSLLASAMVFLAFGAPFAAMLEIIIYAGAIMVLFLFVIMMVNLGPEAAVREREWLRPRAWRGPAALCAVLAAQFIVAFWPGRVPLTSSGVVPPKQVGVALFGPYALGVELASLLLLAGLVGSFHLGRHRAPEGTSGEGKAGKHDNS